MHDWIYNLFTNEKECKYYQVPTSKHCDINGDPSEDVHIIVNIITHHIYIQLIFNILVLGHCNYHAYFFERLVFNITFFFLFGRTYACRRVIMIESTDSSAQQSVCLISLILWQRFRYLFLCSFINCKSQESVPRIKIPPLLSFTLNR